MRMFFFGTIVVSVISSALVGVEPSPKHILVIAHRGAHEDAPENSLAAIRTAIDIGCDYVEVDVRTTSDERLVVVHDGTVDRTTNGKGSVSEMAFAEIRRLRLDPKLPDERVPTFDDALAACKGRIKVYIDHKDASPERVLEAVKKHKMLSDVVVYGDVKTLRAYKKLCPDIWIMPPHPKNSAAIAKLAKSLRPETFNGNITEWTVEQVRAAHAAGVQVWVDNPPFLDNKAGIRASVQLGVDAIQTDHPERVIRILKSLGVRAK